MRRAHVGSQRRPSIEPKPSKPQEHCPQHHIRRIMRLIRQSLRSIPTTLAEVQRNRQRRGTTADMDWCSSCEIETAEDERPAGGVPGPAGDRVVDEGGPDEDEEEEGAETAAFGDGADGEAGGDAGEHELVYAEDDGGDAVGAGRGRIANAAEGEVL